MALLCMRDHILVSRNFLSLRCSFDKGVYEIKVVTAPALLDCAVWLPD